MSQAISEGDGISLIAIVADADAARAAAEAGAEGIAVERPAAGVREATALPLLSLAGEVGDADAALLVVGDVGDQLEPRHLELHGRGLECVVDVRTENLNRFGYDIGAGLAFPVGKARTFWIGPFVRYFQIVQPARVEVVA